MATPPQCEIEVLDFTKDLHDIHMKHMIIHRLNYFKFLENEQSINFKIAAHLLPFNSIDAEDLKSKIFYISLIKEFHQLCGVAELEIQDGYLILKSLVTINAKSSYKDPKKLFFGSVGTNILNRIKEDYKNNPSIKGIKVSDPLETAVDFYLKRDFKENDDDELEHSFRSGDSGRRRKSLVKRRKKKSVRKRKSKSKRKTK